MDKNRQLLALFFAQLVVNTGFGVIVPVLPFFALKLGAQPADIGVLVSAYALLQFVTAPLWGRLSDRIGRKPVLVLGMIGLSVTSVMTGLAGTLWLVVLTRALGGLMAAAVQPAAFAYVGDTTSLADRGRAMGFVSAGMGVGFIIGPALGGALVPWGLAAPFEAAAALSLAAAIVAGAFLRSPPRVQTSGATAQHASPDTRHPSLITPALWSPLGAAVALSFLISLADASRQSTIALYAKDVLGFGSAEMGFVFTLMGITYVALQGLVVGPLIDRLGERRMLLVGLPLSALGFLLVLAAWDLISLSAAIALQGAGMAFTYTSIPTLISKEARGGQGAAMGLRSASQSGGQILGPLVGGGIYTLDRSLPYLLAAILSVLSFVIGGLVFEAQPYLKARGVSGHDRATAHRH